MQKVGSIFEELKNSGIKDYKHAVEILHHFHLTPHPTNFLNTERLPHPETNVHLLKPSIIENNKWAQPFKNVISHLQLGSEVEQYTLDPNKLKDALSSQNFASEKLPWRQMQVHFNSALTTLKLEPFFIAFYLGLLLADFSPPANFPKDNANFLPMNLSTPSCISSAENNDTVIVKFTNLASHDLRTQNQVESFSQLFQLVSLDEESQRRMDSYCDSLIALITTILMQKREILKRCANQSFSYFEPPTTQFSKSEQNPYLLQIFEDLRDFHIIVSQLKNNFAATLNKKIKIETENDDSGSDEDPFSTSNLNPEDLRKLLQQQQAYSRKLCPWSNNK